LDLDELSFLGDSSSIEFTVSLTTSSSRQIL